MHKHDGAGEVQNAKHEYPSTPTKLNVHSKRLYRQMFKKLFRKLTGAPDTPDKQADKSEVADKDSTSPTIQENSSDSDDDIPSDDELAHDRLYPKIQARLVFKRVAPTDEQKPAQVKAKPEIAPKRKAEIRSDSGKSAHEQIFGTESRATGGFFDFTKGVTFNSDSESQEEKLPPVKVSSILRAPKSKEASMIRECQSPDGEEPRSLVSSMFSSIKNPDVEPAIKSPIQRPICGRHFFCDSDEDFPQVKGSPKPSDYPKKELNRDTFQDPPKDTVAVFARCAKKKITW